MAVVVAASVWGEAEDMPTLNWMEREKAVRADKNVVLKILREDKSLSYSGMGGTRSVASVCQTGLTGFTGLECDRPAALTQRTQSSQSDAKTDAPGRGTRPACPPCDNLLVHGDNLEALKALLPFYAGRVKCIYIDPPYNTGNMFEQYDDNLEHSTWLSVMYPRIKLLKEFLTPDGNFFMQLDDNELDYAKVFCDEIFGRKNFVNRITIDVRAPSAFSTVNPGVFKCSEYILWYANDKSFVPMVEERVIRDVDFAYKDWLENPSDSYEDWKFTTVAAAYAKMKKPKDNPVSDYKQYQAFVVKNADRICRRASISDSGAGQDVIELKKKSLENPGKILFMARDKHDDVYVLDGEQIIFYGKNIREINGIKQATKQITNIWNDIPWEGIAKEGGVVLKKSKKPERLIQRILTIATNPGDLVLDSFLGSGTTCAVAQKMNRRWIGIEMGDHAKTHCAVRLRKVIDGEQGGISKAVGWQGGGAFRFYELGEPILDENGAITETIPYETLAAHVWFMETGCGWDGPVGLNGSGADGVRALPAGVSKSTVLGVHDGVAYALLYNGILHDRSVSGGNVLTPKTLKVILADLGDAAHERLVVYGECTKIGAAKLKELKIEFRQTPYDIAMGR